MSTQSEKRDFLGSLEVRISPGLLGFPIERLGQRLIPATAYKPVVRLPSSSNDDDVVFDYKVPGTETSLHLVMDLDIGLRPGIVQRLLSRALLLVTSILDVAGDGIVPGQRFTQDYEDMYGYGLSVGIWSDRIIHDRMTYSVLKDTLVGLWDRMVTRRLAYQTVIHVSREDVGIVAFGIVRWVSEDTAA
ncbi:MAG: hypothetical protein L6R35_004416 [Caloplaca aegaea]|nr:MAG: hypothetical protein L6R35_004416 [Caloplaca aegaea]